MHPRKQTIIDIFGKEPETMDELAQCVMKFIESQKNDGCWGKKTEIIENYKILGFEWDLRWKDRVSNTHCAPLSGDENWSGVKGSPAGYPGWIGRVWIRYAEEQRGNPFSLTLTHTGTGGGGSYDGPWTPVSAVRYNRYGYTREVGQYPEIHCYSWDYKIFDDDWPIISGLLEEDRLWNKIKGSARETIHQFVWEDPETVKRDNEFLADTLHQLTW